MVPEYLSRQTRQTRAALMLLSAGISALYFFDGGIDVNMGASLLGITIKLDEAALYLTLTVFIFYFFISFLFSAMAEKIDIGLSPKEQRLVQDIFRMKDSQDRISITLRMQTLQALIDNKDRYRRSYEELNTMFEKKPLPENGSDLLERVYEIAIDESVNRLPRLMMLIGPIENTLHVNLFLQPITQSYSHSMGKAFGARQHLYEGKDLEKQSEAHIKEVSDKIRKADIQANVLMEASQKVLAALKAETSNEDQFAKRVSEKEKEIEIAAEKNRFSLKPVWSVTYINYIILEFIFPLIVGAVGLFSVIMLQIK
ncbi:hypothetical protein [Hyphococcus sp.]|uniref:hypothetical protein n=1 Tax=Hyphococcus sp. TaxID=2038636 RepID=UPI003D10F4A8